MDYRGPDLDLRTTRWAASSTDPAGWREASPQQQGQVPAAPRSGSGRPAPIWVDETVLGAANQAFDVAVAYRSPEVQLIHLLLAMTRIDAAASQLEARGVGVAALRRDCAITIAADVASVQGVAPNPRRSAELEDVLRLAASRASHANRPANVEDIVQVLAEVGGDLHAAEVIVRHFPRAERTIQPARSAPAAAPNHLRDFAVTDRTPDPDASHGEAHVVPVIDEAGVHRLLERFAESERHLSERVQALEAMLARLPGQPVGELGAIEQRLAAIEQGLQNRSTSEGIVSIDPAINDRLWSIEHALGTERTERASSVTALSDEITGVRSAVRLSAQNSEQAHASVMEEIRQLASGLEQHRIDLASSLGDRIAAIEEALDGHGQKMSELHSAYAAELSEVHEALMKISANQHTLAGSIDHWRNNESAEIHLINSRIGAVHEDGAQRLSVIEKLSSDVETLSHLVLDERTKPPTTFRQWLFGTEEWAKPSWRLPKLRRPSLKFPRFARLRPLRRRAD
jgi:ATP-dependent Clp protease ATP-binding subunit ClpA